MAVQYTYTGDIDRIQLYLGAYTEFGEGRSNRLSFFNDSETIGSPFG
jgi:hypothetical protein